MTLWIDRHNDLCRKAGKQDEILSKQRTLENITCHKCGGKFHRGNKCISYITYTCQCGRTIRKDTGYTYNG